MTAPGPLAVPLEPLRRAWRASAPLHGVVAFLAGFTYDALTLQRIDRLFDNLFLLAYLLLLGLLLVVEIRLAHGRVTWGPLVRRGRWVRLGAQFLFGGLYSAYFIFYFKSASLGPPIFFLGLLLALLVINEFLGRYIRAERLRLALYYLAAFSFLLFFIPVVTGWPGPGLFALAGVGAFALTASVLVLGHLPSPAELRQARVAPPLAPAAPLVGPAVVPGPPPDASLPPLPTRPFSPTRLGWVVGSNGLTWMALFALLGLAAHLNLVPPVPFGLMQGGIFHEVRRTPEGVELTWEDPGLRVWVRHDRRFRYRPGDRAWFYTAVFAPRGMELTVWHHWERWDEATGRWLTTDRIPLEIRGGRDGGFRTWSTKRNLPDGRWRARVVARDGREIGRRSFTVEHGEHPPPEWRTRLHR